MDRNSANGAPLLPETQFRSQNRRIQPTQCAAVIQSAAPATKLPARKRRCPSEHRATGCLRRTTALCRFQEACAGRTGTRAFGAILYARLSRPLRLVVL